ncbi:MAG: tetratricopeptide repeat protein [Deltaproteobacteria bacterium]|nr:tetratricopeptide repeat protein [Deltaproteobacteria bacterium]
MKIKLRSTMSKLKILLIIVLTVSGCATVDLQPRKDAYHYYSKGLAYDRAGEYDAAIEQYKMAIKVEPNDPAHNIDWTESSYFQLALTYMSKGQCKDAVFYYQKVMATTTPNSHNSRLLAQCYNELNQYNNAVFCYQNVIASGDGNTHTFRLLAQSYNKLNQYNNAIKAGKRAIELDFSNDYAHFELAYAFFKTKQYKNAVKAYKKAIELDPKVPNYYSRWGALLGNSGDYAGAAEQYEKAVSLEPNNLKYRSGVYLAYYEQGRYNDALDAVDKTVPLMSFAGIGADLQIEENYPVVTTVFDPSPAKKAGIKAGDKIIKVDGKTIKGWKLNDVISDIKGQEGTSVVFLIERKDTQKPLEIAVIRENIIQEEASPVFGIRSLIFRYIGKKQESLKDAKQAYFLDSSGKWAQVALGAAYLDQGQYDEAVKLLSQVKKSTHARILEATAYAKKGDFKKAIDIYSAIPEGKPSPKSIPTWSDRAALLDTLEPFIASKIETAGKLKTQGRYKEALIELGYALKIADDTTSKEICGSIYRIMSLDPRLSGLPEEAIKYTLRGDVLTEEGKFGEAVKEYLQAVQAAPYIAKLYFNTAVIYGELKRHPQAIRNMKTYLLLAPEAPNARAAKNQIYKWEFAMEKEK